MKLCDIKDWDKIKLSNRHIKSKYVKWHCDDEVFYDDIDERWYEDVFMLVEDTNWEVYEEPKVDLPKLSSINGIKISETLAGKINISYFWQQSNLTKSIIELNNMLRVNFGEVLKEIVTEPNPLGYETELKIKE